MKRFNLIFLVICLLNFFTIFSLNNGSLHVENTENTNNNTNFETNYFEGLWKANGYHCDGKIYDGEIIKITKEDNKLKAVKQNSNGDLCVKQGEVTFTANLPVLVFSNMNHLIRFNLGKSKSEERMEIFENIHVDDLNTFSIGDRVFKRIRFTKIK